jgi:HTH-type transcriptional regulator/antitoxin HipB
MVANGDMPGGFMRVRTPADFAAVVRDRRLKRGWKQVDLARKVGAGRQWIVDLERGKPGARLALVLRTLDALGITLTVGLASGAGKRTTKKASGTRRPVDIDRLLDNLRKKKS